MALTEDIEANSLHHLGVSIFGKTFGKSARLATSEIREFRAEAR
jgi:hypothetical protein